MPFTFNPFTGKLDKIIKDVWTKITGGIQYDSGKVIVGEDVVEAEGVDSYVKLLLHADGSGATFTDNSASAHTITANGGATQSATQYKFGGKSAYFDGVDSYLSLSDSDDWNFADGDFTIDFWVYPSAVNGIRIVYSQENAGHYSPVVIGIIDGVVGCLWSSNGSGWDNMSHYLGSTGISANNWYHIAVVRESTTIKIYINGTLDLTITGVGTLFNSTNDVILGYYSGWLYNGYVDELRVSKGVARWTTNFTPPASPYSEVESFIGKLGINKETPTAYLHIGKGKSSAGNAPLKIDSGTVLTTPESGAIENDGTDLFFTPSDTRKTVAMADDLHSAVTLAAIGSTPNANGASLSTQALNLQPADGTYGGVVTTGAQTIAGKKTLTGGLRVGSDTDYFELATDGGSSMLGAGCGKLTLRPNIVQSRKKISDNKPTEVQRGLNIGYSFPIYNSDDEELFFRMRIPARWDGTTDPQFGIMCTITGAEDVGDKFKFQLEWQTTKCGGDTVMGTTTSNCVSEQTIITGGAAANTAYCVFFTLNADDATNPIEAGDMLQGRLRRIAASANEVSNEIAVWDWAVMWRTNKIYPDWSVESNVT